MSIGLKASVDPARCKQVASQLQRMTVPVPREDVPEMPFSKAEEANFWFLLAAICHQTSPDGLPPLEGEIDGAPRRGWDYLLHSFRVAAVTERKNLAPSTWVVFDAQKVTSIFGDRIEAPDRRAVLIRDLGQGLIKRRWDSILPASQHCNHLLMDHTPNLMGLLSEFEAYSDPVEKKSVFFLALMQNSGLWAYADGERLPAPVDYHEVRGHLRIGTVRVEDSSLKRKIRNGVPVSTEDDVAVRMTVREAIQLIADSVGNSPNALHYFFWNLFRTYCVRMSPKCGGGNFANLPRNYAIAISSGGSRECPFRGFCDSADLQHAINEHKVATEYY